VETLSECIGNRRYRREIIKLAKGNAELADDLGKAIASRVIEDEMGPELKGDLFNYVKANNVGINAVSFSKLRKLMIRVPEFAPYAFCNMKATYSAKYLMEEGELEGLVRFWTKYAKDGGEHLKAVSQEQQLMFNAIGAFMSIQYPPVAAPFDFDGSKALNSLKQSPHLISFGVDFQRFPKKLSEDSASGITFDSFIREDNGAKSLKIFGKAATTPVAAAKWLQKVTGPVFLWPGVMTSIGMKIRSGTLEFEDYALKHTEDEVRAMHARVADRFTKGLDFFDSLPDYSVEPPTGEKEFFARMGIKEYTDSASNELGRVYAHMADATSSVGPTFKKIWSGITLANPELAKELYDSVKPLIARAVATWSGSTKEGEPIFTPKKESRPEPRPASRSPYAQDPEPRRGRPGADDSDSDIDEDDDVS